MSYITLFLTMEYVVIPRIRTEHPKWGIRQVGAEKLRYFYQLLNDTSGDAAARAALNLAPPVAPTSAGSSASALATSKITGFSVSSPPSSTSAASAVPQDKNQQASRPYRIWS